MEAKMKKLFLMAICTVFLTTSISHGYQATFTPRISVGGEYTDNVFLTSTDKEDDFITTITPGFTGQILGKTSGAELSYDPSYAFYNTFDEYNGWRHDARFSGWVNLAKYTRLDVRDNFLYTEDPLRNADIAIGRTEDPDLPIDSTIRESRQIYYTNFASVDLEHQFGEEDSFRLGYVNYLLRNDDPTYDDNDGQKPSIGLTYWFLPQWGFEANASYTKAEFELSEDRDLISGDVSLIKRFTRQIEGYIRYMHLMVDYDGLTEDDSTYNPSIGIKYLIADDISCFLDVGWFYNDFELRDDQYGPTADLRLIKTFQRGSLNIAASGGYDYSLFGAETLNFEEFYEIAGSATYRLAKHLNGNIFASYRNDDYIDADREDKTTRAGLGLTMQALPWMSFGLYYTFRNVDSTSRVDEYDENRALLRVTFSPARPYRTSQ
jgi:putative beta-barrel porin BBP2